MRWMQRTFSTLLALPLAACASSPPRDSPAADAAAARGARIETMIVRRSSAGVDSGPPTSLAIRMEELRVPGVSVAVFDSGRVVWARGFGVVDAPTGVPVDTLTLFQAASVSKPLAAAGMFRLVEQGHLQLDADVNTMLRSWQLPPSPLTATEKVTLRRIVSHTSGLGVRGFLGYVPGDSVPSLLEILDGRPPANSAPLRVEVVPGTEERYSGGGVTLMQFLMEEVTGLPFATLMDSLVLQPAGMRHSTFAQPLPPSLATVAATGHDPEGAPLPGRYRTHPEQAAGGLWATAPDLARFMLSFGRSYRGENGGLLAQASAQVMLSRPPHGNAHGFGVSGADATFRYRHSGGNEGFRCFAVAFAGIGRGAIVLTNSDNGSALYPEILDAISRTYGWPRMTMGAP